MSDLVERATEYAQHERHEGARNCFLECAARIEELEARLREEIMSGYDHLTDTRKARYNGPEEYAEAVLSSEQSSGVPE